MRRSAELAPLSRDHQHALAVALAMRRGADDAGARFADFLESEGRRHFAIEEDLVLPALAPGPDGEREEVVRVLLDHVALRRAGDALERGEEIDLEAVGRRLDGHVRFEERVLFPLVEDVLGAERLAALGAAIAAREP